jgi:23S rRNA pseudouridine1911/1915/1917 synthase
LLPSPSAPQTNPEPIPLSIIHQDQDIIVINKPAGMVTHPAHGHQSGTLVNALLHHCPDLAGIGWELRPGIAHRLDKDTSGAIVAAKNEKALASLLSQFKNRSAKKIYLAIVRGRVSPASGTIRTLIGRSRADRTKMTAEAKRGRLSISEFRTLSSSEDISLVLVVPRTGRTHQVRVHMAHIGHPVAGDRKYGGAGEGAHDLPAARQMLHAWKLSIKHPSTGAEISFTAPIPPDMADLMRIARLNMERAVQQDGQD